MAGKNLFSWENHPVKKVALTRRRWSLRRLERPRPVGNGEGPAGRAVVALPASLQLLLQVSQGCVIWGNHRKGLSDTRQRKGTKPGGFFCTVFSPECLPPQEPSILYVKCLLLFLLFQHLSALPLTKRLPAFDFRVTGHLVTMAAFQRQISATGISQTVTCSHEKAPHAQFPAPPS